MVLISGPSFRARYMHRYCFMVSGANPLCVTSEIRTAPDVRKGRALPWDSASFSARAKAGFGESALQCARPIEDGLALTSAVMRICEANGILVAEAFAHLCKRHGFIGRKLERDPHRGDSPSSWMVNTSLELTCRSRARMTLAASRDSAWIAATFSIKSPVALEESRSASRCTSAALIVVGITGIRRPPRF